MMPLARHARVLARLDHFARFKSLRFLWFSLFALVALWTALGDAARLNDFHDAHFLFAYDHHAAKTVLEYGQFPLWDPWACGGMHALGSPQTRFASPPFLVALLVGPERAIPLIAFLLMLVGSEGLFRYLRLRTPAPFFAALIAPAFMLSGFMATSYALGWLQFYGFAFLPWVLLGTHRAFHGHLRGFAIAPFAFAFMVGFGGTYAPPLTALLIAFEGLATFPLLAPARTRDAVLRWCFRGIILALLIAAAVAFRVVPVLDEISRGPRVMAGSPGYSFEHLLSMMFGTPDADPTGDRPGRYLAGQPLLAVFAAIGLFRRETRIKGLFFVFLFLAATGYHYGAGPFTWLRQLPVFDTLRYPERILFVGSIFYLELITSGLHAVTRYLRRVSKPMIPSLSLALVVIAIPASHAHQTIGFQTITSAIRYAPIPDTQDQPFALSRGNRWVANLFAYQNRGFISCGEAWPVPMSKALRGDLQAEAAFSEVDAGTVMQRDWSPNRIVFDVNLVRPAVLHINQNHHPGWHSNVGDVIDAEHRLAVDLPAGQHAVVLSFLPRSAVIGLATTIMFALGLFVLWVHRRKAIARWSETRYLAGLCVFPVVGLLGGIFLGPTQIDMPPRVFNPDGSPVVIDGVPSGMTPVGVSFDLPVEIVAARFGPPDTDGLVAGELLFRVTGPVPRTVGLFVHVFDNDRHVAGSDAEVIAGTWFLANAPKNVLLRHAFAIRPGTPPPSGDRRFFAGLYHISGDGSRVMPKQGARTTPDGRVQVQP